LGLRKNIVVSGDFTRTIKGNATSQVMHVMNTDICCYA
jgi:hypothetical protein